MECSGKELDSRQFIYNLPSMRYYMHPAVKNYQFKWRVGVCYATL